MTQVLYSTNDEDYTYTELDDAVDDVFGSEHAQLGDVEVVYSGEVMIRKAGSYIPDIPDYISERAYDDCGEIAEDWPDVSMEIKDELQTTVEEAVNAWADRHGVQPTFGDIVNIREIKVRLTGDNYGDFEVVSD